MTDQQPGEPAVPIAAPSFGEAEVTAVADVLETGIVADGPEVRRFEDEFAAYCGTEYAVATANGTAALHAALEAVGIGLGDAVVTTPFSFVASANAIRLAGATPVFADIDPGTYVLEPDAVERAVRATGAAGILAVHLYGLPAALDVLVDVAEDTGAVLIEDAAQAHGARYDGRHVGTYGDVAAFSFYPTKNMTTGEGGMIVTDQESVATRAERYVNHGRHGSDAYVHDEFGHNYRMTSIEAALGRVQLKQLPAWVDCRRRHAARLTEGLLRVPGVTVPEEPGDREHAYHQYTIRCRHRDALRERLASAGVETAVYYPTPIHELGAYEGFDGDYPVAERAARQVLSLPVHPALDDHAIERVIDAMRREFVHVL